MDAENEESPPDTDSTVQVLPKVGMVFHSEDHAYVFYNQYAKSVGFSVRKDSSTVRPDRTVIRRVLCCSKQGHYKNRGPLTNLRARTRTGCEARIIILRRGEKFLLIEFKESHNHELVAPSEVHRLRSQRKIEDYQARLMRNMYRAGNGPTDVYSSMCKTFSGPQNLSFTELDCANYLQRIRRDDNVGKRERGDDRGNLMFDSQPSSDKGDDHGTSMVIDCHPSSSLQTNDLAHLALTIVAKGNTNDNSVVFTRRLLTQVLEELDIFLKSDSDKNRYLEDMNHNKVCEDKNCADEVGVNTRMQNLPWEKANGKVSGKMKCTSEKGKVRKKAKKLSTGPCDRVSIGTIGTTLLMLQDSTLLPKHHYDQEPKQLNLPREDS